MIKATKHFQFYAGDGCSWIRLFGYGFAVLNKIKHRPLFSERNGYRKVWRFGDYGVELLYPNS